MYFRAVMCFCEEASPVIASKATLKVMESLQSGRYESLHLRRKKLSHLHEKWILLYNLLCCVCYPSLIWL